MFGRRPTKRKWSRSKPNHRNKPNLAYLARVNIAPGMMAWVRHTPHEFLHRLPRAAKTWLGRRAVLHIQRGGRDDQHRARAHVSSALRLGRLGSAHRSTRGQAECGPARSRGSNPLAPGVAAGEPP